MAAELDKIVVTNLDTGVDFDLWESVSLSSDFLTPCDSFRLECGAEMSAPEIARKLPVGSVVRIAINDYPQLHGYVEKIGASFSRGGGTKLTIEGRDFLSNVVDGNIDPRMQIPKDVTLEQLVMLVLKDQFAIPVGIEPRDTNTRSLAAGKPLGSKKSYKGKHKREKPLKDVVPHDNEGAFSYLSRILTHYGYWLWASVDGTYVVVAGPDYDQPAAYTLTSMKDQGGTGAGQRNTVLDASFTYDDTSVPTHVFCRGTSSSKATKTSVFGQAVNSLSTRFKPVYISDKDATTLEKAECIAKVFLSRQVRNLFVYEVTVAGFTDRESGGIWTVNSIVNVNDENVGVSGPMWIESRTFTKSRSGTTTHLKMIPPGTLILDWQPDEVPPTAPTSAQAYADAIKAYRSQAPAKTGDYSHNGVEFFLPNV